MNVAQALEHANALYLPGFVTDDAALTAERQKNEEAISVLSAAWMSAPAGSEPFSFDVVRSLADRNRDTCDEYGAARLRDARGNGLARRLSDGDLARGVAALQGRTVREVERSAGPGLKSLDAALAEAPVGGTVVGIDIETTDRYPDRGYIVNVGLQIGAIAADATYDEGCVAYCGLPDMYEQAGVPLADIHHITWGDVAGKEPFRTNRALQTAVLAALTTYPFMAHNAAFEDSWFMLHLDGYAEARKAGRVLPIDTRDICRRLDEYVATALPSSSPASLENWARRRGTLAANEAERHLGLDDVNLMLRTVQAEFARKNLFRSR
jgi:hypothetical protein